MRITSLIILLVNLILLQSFVSAWGYKGHRMINEKGDSKIKISVEENNKNYLFELKDKRKFNYQTLKFLNNEPYIKKITV